MVKNPTGSIRKAHNPQLTVLVVEDHAIFTKTVRHALPEERVLIAPDLETARTLFAEHMPDMVFLDIDLPDGTGHEFLTEIRQDDEDTYVVMMTGSKLDMDRELSYLHGAQAYLVKPCTHEALRQQAEQYLAYREERMNALLGASNRSERAAPGQTG